MSYAIGEPPYYTVTYGGLPVNFPTDYWTDKPYLSGVTAVENWITSHGYTLNLGNGYYTLVQGEYNPPSGSTVSGCFIATAAYGTSLHKDLDTLRAFRDEKLPDELVDLYYRASPPFAKVISHSAILRWVIRQPLRLIVWILSNS